MNKEETIALGLGLVSTILLIPRVRYPVLELVGNPLGAVVGVLLILYALVNHHALIAMVLTAVVLYLMNAQDHYVTSNEQQVYRDTTKDDARFVPATSVDLQLANKTFVRDSANMLNPPEPTPTLLAYPPSQETLRSLSG